MNTSSNEYSFYDLERLNHKIEKLDKTHHIDILRIITENSTIPLTENQNGIFINMTDLSNMVITKVVDFLQYVDKKNEDLEVFEKEKSDLLELINESNTVVS
jgi:hypothetical protein